jgi:hypothetical protein
MRSGLHLSSSCDVLNIQDILLRGVSVLLAHSISLLHSAINSMSSMGNSTHMLSLYLFNAGLASLFW